MNAADKLREKARNEREWISRSGEWTSAFSQHVDALELLAEAWGALYCGEPNCAHPDCILAARIEAFANDEKKEGE